MCQVELRSTNARPTEMIFFFFFLFFLFFFLRKQKGKKWKKLVITRKPYCFCLIITQTIEIGFEFNKISKRASGLSHNRDDCEHDCEMIIPFGWSYFSAWAINLLGENVHVYCMCGCVVCVCVCVYGYDGWPFSLEIILIENELKQNSRINWIHYFTNCFQ